MSISKQFSFDKQNAEHVLHVAGWTFGSALVVMVIDFLGLVEIPAEYTIWVPLVNTLLVALKEWMTEQSRK